MKNKRQTIIEDVNSILSKYQYTLSDIDIDNKSMVLNIKVDNNFSKNRNEFLKYFIINNIANYIKSIQHNENRNELKMFILSSKKYSTDGEPLVRIKRKKKKCLYIFQKDYEEILNIFKEKNITTNINKKIIEYVKNNSYKYLYMKGEELTKNHKENFKSQSPISNRKSSNRKNKRYPKKEKFKQIKKLTFKQYLLEMKNLYNKKGRLSSRKKHWVHFIKNNILECPVTKKKVSYCSYDYKKSSNSYHYNFYSEDGDLFTVDHKIPISKGGNKDCVKNVQPMIYLENIAKGNELIYT